MAVDMVADKVIETPFVVVVVQHRFDNMDYSQAILLPYFYDNYFIKNFTNYEIIRKEKFIYKRLDKKGL